LLPLVTDYNKKQSCCCECADHTALSGTATQHADDGYSRREILWFACSDMFLWGHT